MTRQLCRPLPCHALAELGHWNTVPQPTSTHKPGISSDVNRNLVVGGEMDDFYRLIGIATPVIAALPLETVLDAFVERCLLVKATINAQGLEQIHASIVAKDGHVWNRLQRLACKICPVGCFQVACTISFGFRPPIIITNFMIFIFGISLPGIYFLATTIGW